MAITTAIIQRIIVPVIFALCKYSFFSFHFDRRNIHFSKALTAVSSFKSSSQKTERSFIIINLAFFDAINQIVWRDFREILISTRLQSTEMKYSKQFVDWIWQGIRIKKIIVLIQFKQMACNRAGWNWEATQNTNICILDLSRILDGVANANIADILCQKTSEKKNNVHRW